MIIHVQPFLLKISSSMISLLKDIKNILYLEVIEILTVMYVDSLYSLRIAHYACICDTQSSLTIPHRPLL